MANCRCGAEILWVTPVNGGEPIAIEAHVVSYRGPGRWNVEQYGSPWRVEPVDANAPVAAHPDHRLACPMASAADRRRVNHALRGDDDAAAHDGPSSGQRGSTRAG